MTIKKNLENGIINRFIYEYNKKYATELSLKELSDKPDAICYCDKTRLSVIGIEIVELLQNPSHKIGEQRAMEGRYYSAIQIAIKDVFGDIRIIADVEIKYPFPSKRYMNINKEIELFKKYLIEIKSELLEKKIYSKPIQIGNYMFMQRIAIRVNQNLNSELFHNNMPKENDVIAWEKKIREIIESKKTKAKNYKFGNSSLYLLIRNTWKIDNIKEIYDKREFYLDSLLPFNGIWIFHFPLNVIDIEYKISLVK